MAKFCPECGAALTGAAKFCPECGKPIPQAEGAAQPVPQPAQPQPQPVPQPAQPQPQPVPQAAQPYAYGAAENQTAQTYAYGAAESRAAQQGIPAPGFSSRVNDPKILAAVRKNRKIAGVFSLLFIPLPLVGFVVYSIVSDKMEFGQAVKIGGFVSLVFLMFALYSRIKERAANTYEATVIDKKTRRVLRHKNVDSDDDNNYYTEYIIVARTTDGKKKKIVEREGSQIWAWEYLDIGDRFKYHPQFHFPYELYNKSKAPYIACVSCGTRNPVSADCCKKCGLPLLK